MCGNGGIGMCVCVAGGGERKREREETFPNRMGSGKLQGKQGVKGEATQQNGMAAKS